MVRKGLLILGVALALLSAFGLAADRRVTLLWFDVIAAILSFGSAFIIDDERALGASLGAGPAMLALGLLAIWIAGLAGGQAAWAVWANVAFAAAYAALAGAAVIHRHRQISGHARA